MNRKMYKIKVVKRGTITIYAMSQAEAQYKVLDAKKRGRFNNMHREEGEWEIECISDLEE